MHREFKTEPNLIYLNSGTHSLCPNSVHEAVLRYYEQYESNPTRGLQKTWSMLWNVQKELARFFNADPRDLILRANVTQLLNLFILGLPLSDGDEILTTDLEYGAIFNICKFRARREKRELRTLHLPCTRKEYEELDADQIADLVIQELKPHTKMLVVSHIMTGNGLILPIEKIARETRKRGVFFVVDGAHAPGSIPLDFAKLGNVDFYTGNLHKWMMGPKGTAFGWVNREQQPKLNAIEAGWTSFETLCPHDEFGGGSRFASEFMLSGCHDFTSFFAIRETLEFIEAQGFPQILKVIYSHQAKIESLLEDSRFQPISPPAGPLRGPLLSYDLPEKAQKSGYSLMAELCQKEHLQIAITSVQGRWRLRVSPHIYNTEAELEKAAAILKSTPLI